MLENYYLTIIIGKNRGKIFPIQEGVSLIGRKDLAARLTPPVDLEEEDVDAKVSRRHANIHLNTQEIIVEDLGSLNGTSVIRDGGWFHIPSNERAEVKIGDDIVIGGVVLRILNNAPKI